jgi:phage terminase small subunit
MLQAASEFGLTPSARSRIIAGNAVMNEASEMDMILAGVI